METTVGVKRRRSCSRKSIDPEVLVKLNKRETKILGLLDATEPCHVDELIGSSGLRPEEVLATLLVLEVRRLCKQLPGKRYLKTAPDEAHP